MLPTSTRRCSNNSWRERCEVYLETGSLEGVEDKELLEQVLAVSGHVERNAILSPQDPLPQLLMTHDQTRKTRVNRSEMK